MPNTGAIRRWAEEFHAEIFRMRNNGQLGSLEEELPRPLLRSLIVSKLATLKIDLSEDQLDALVRDFPIVDLDPADTYPNQDEVWEREVGSITALLRRVVPGVARQN